MLTQLNQVLPHPPVTRGVEAVVSTLKENGHQVLPWTPYKHDFGHDLINDIYAADGSTVSEKSLGQRVSGQDMKY